MPFPVSRSVKIPIDARWRDDEVLDEIQRELPGLGAIRVRRADDKLAFDVSWLTNYGPLFCITGGEFTFDPELDSGRMKRLRCSLSFRRAAVIVAIATYGWLGLGVSLVEGQYTGGSLGATLLFCTIGYCWLLGFWYLAAPPWLEHRLKLLRFVKPPALPAV
jgi:hypothetical protein